MEGISRASGAGPVVDFGGEQVRVSGQILRHHALIEAQILHQRGNPFDGISQMVNSFTGNKAVLREIVDVAFENARSWRFVRGDETIAWLDEWGGACFTIYLAVRDNDPEKYTLDYVTRVYSDTYEDIMRRDGQAAAVLWTQQLMDAVDQATGNDDLGKPTGGQPSETAGTDTGEPTGEKSTAP